MESCWTISAATAGEFLGQTYLTLFLTDLYRRIVSYLSFNSKEVRTAVESPFTSPLTNLHVGTPA